MMKIKFTRLNIIIAVFLLFSVSCTEKEEKDCLGNNIECLKTKIEVKSSQKFDSLKIFSNELNKEFFRGKNTKKNIEIPLNFNAESSVINIGFYYKSELTIDTIIFKHNPIISSKDINCGFSGFFDIKTINFTKSFIDSITVINKIVNSENAENIKICI